MPDRCRGPASSVQDLQDADFPLQKSYLERFRPRTSSRWCGDLGHRGVQPLRERESKRAEDARLCMSR